MSIHKIVSRNKAFYSDVFKLKLHGIVLSKAARKGIRAELAGSREHLRIVFGSI